MSSAAGQAGAPWHTAKNTAARLNACSALIVPDHAVRVLFAPLVRVHCQLGYERTTGLEGKRDFEITTCVHYLRKYE